MSDRFVQLEKDLRSAVSRRSYDDAQRIAANLCAQAAKDWRGLPPEDPGARHIFDKLQSVLEWARRVFCIYRASLEDELRRALLADRYRNSIGAPRHRLRFDV